MKRVGKLFALITTGIVCFWVCGTGYCETTKVVKHMAVEHKAEMEKWLRTHRDFRMATEADCDCSDSLKDIRFSNSPGWPANPNYLSYYVVGDFNHDGMGDFAVLLIKKEMFMEKLYVGIFNGTSVSNQYMPTILKAKGFDIVETGLFYGPPRPKPYSLIIGVFNSEGVAIVPSKNGYKFDDSE